LTIYQLGASVFPRIDSQLLYSRRRWFTVASAGRSGSVCCC